MPRMIQGLALLAAVSLLGCNDYATDECSPDDAPVVADFWAGPGVTDVTFLAFGDSQVFADTDDGGFKNAANVQALNVAETLDWSSLQVAQDVANVRGVLLAGDLTQIGRDWRNFDTDEYKVVVENYGLCGNRVLNVPLYEGYGNHDFRNAPVIGYGNEHPVANSVAIRNDYRAGLSNKASGLEGHYSWDWDGIHFINVNLAPSDVVPDLDPGVRDPRNALTYLVNDLASLPVGQRVVIMQHYAPNSTTFEWDQAQIDAFQAAITGYNVIAIIHGHWHNTSNYTITVGGVDIPVFNVGSPYYQPGNGEGDGRGHFGVFRITDDKIYAMDASWGIDDPTALTAPDDWSRIVDLAS